MKEYYSENGGRHLYNSDIKNLQDLALSATKMFGDCEDGFVLCGCAVEDNHIGEGFVFIDGKVRYVSETDVSNLTNLCIVKKNTEGGNIQYYNGGTHKQFDEYGTVISEGLPSSPSTDYIRFDTVLGRFPNISDVYFNRHLLVKDGASQSVYSQITFALKTIMSGITLFSDSNFYTCDTFMDDDGNLNVCIYGHAVELVTYKFGSDGTIGIYQDNVLRWKFDGTTGGSDTGSLPSIPSTGLPNPSSTDSSLAKVYEVTQSGNLSKSYNVFIVKNTNLKLVLPSSPAEGKTIKILWPSGSHTIQVNISNVTTDRILTVGTDMRSPNTFVSSLSRVSDLVYHSGNWYLTDFM